MKSTCLPLHIKTAYVLVFILQMVFSTSFAQSQPITIASYNLGWWLNQAEFKDYVSTCFSETPDKLVKLGADTQGLPPCNVYAGQDPVTLTMVPTLQYWEAKKNALKITVERAQADVMAFIEVSGKLSVEQMLGEQLKNDYWMCESALNPKQIGITREQQRIVIISKKTIFANPETQPNGCISEEGTRIEAKDGRFTRPTLVSNLTTMSGKPLTIIALHLKSRCASPAGDENFNWTGDLLNSKSEHCITLRKQIAPLEEIVKKYTTGGRNVVMLGDFNRKIHFEIPTQKANGFIDYKAGSARVEIDEFCKNGKPIISPKYPNPTPSDTCQEIKQKSTAGIPSPTDSIRLFWPEIIDFDAQKDANGKWQLPSNPILTILNRDLKNTDCKGFDGLDHITVSNSISKVNPMATVREVAQNSFSNLSIPASDHCPIMTNLIIP